jgi:hypothetical protein
VRTSIVINCITHSSFYTSLPRIHSSFKLSPMTQDPFRCRHLRSPCPRSKCETAGLFHSRTLDAHSAHTPHLLWPQPLQLRPRHHPVNGDALALASNAASIAPLTRLASPVPVSESQRSRPQYAPLPINVSFPYRLPEPPRKQISSEVLSSLGFTPMVSSQYICDIMESFGSIMCQALRSTKAAVPGSTLRKTLAINLNGQTSTTMPPTHMAAIYSSASPGPEPCRVTMYPIHQSILSLYCANLPMLAVSTPLPTTPEAPFEVPVMLLALPNLDSSPS